MESARRAAGAFQYGTSSAFDARNRLRFSVALTGDPGGETGSGLVTEFGLDPNGNRRFVRDPKGNVTETTFDLADRPVDTIDGKAALVSRVIWNDNDLREEVLVAPPAGSGAAGLVLSQRFFYNLRNELKTATDAHGGVVGHFYDANSNLVRRVDEAGAAREFQPDELDRVEVERFPTQDGRVGAWGYHYDSRGNRDRVTDPRGRIYTFIHDAAGRLRTLLYPPIVTGPQPGPSHAESWDYNTKGELVLHRDAMGEEARFGYDSMGRLETEVHTLGFIPRASIRREYDGASNVLSVTDGVSGLAVEYVTPQGAPGYDKLNRPTDVRWRVSGMEFRRLHYTYDAASNGETMSGPDGEVVFYAHDANNRLEGIFRNSRQMAGFTFDAGGRPATTTLGNGVGVTRTYDTKGQVTTIRTRSSGGALLPGYAYPEYSARGERKRMDVEHLGIAVAYGYSPRGWLESELYSGSLVSSRSYQYDDNGNRTKAIRDGQLCEYFHDEENRLFRERCALGGGGQIAGAPFVSSTKPGRTPAVLVDGDTTDSPDEDFSWQNDPKVSGPIFAGLDFGQPRTASELRFWIPTMGGNTRTTGMRRFKVQSGDGASFQDVVVTGLVGAEFSTASPGWLKTVEPPEHAVIVTFVPTTAGVIRILMDVGPEAPGLATTMRLNEIQVFGPRDEEILYFYDPNGNQSRRLQGVVEEIFGYDYRNYQTSYVRRNGASVESAFSYSAMPTGERVSKMNVLTTETQWYMQDGGDVVADYTTTSGSLNWQPSASYVNALGVDSKIARIDPSGAAFWYVGDALGSATQVLNDQQAVVNSYLTTAWGEDLKKDGVLADRYGFTQRERDDESSLMHYRARSYDPRLGRFVHSDPIWANRPFEHYAYAGDNPVTRSDPMGNRWTIKPTGGALQMLNDLMVYTGREAKVDQAGNVWFGDSWGKQYASQADFDWIWKVQNDKSQTDVADLWRHLVGGDDWHRKQFAKAWNETFNPYSPVKEAFKQGNSWGIYESAAEYQEDPAFRTSLWMWRTAQVALAIATLGASAEGSIGIAGGTAGTGHLGTTGAAGGGALVTGATVAASNPGGASRLAIAFQQNLAQLQQLAQRANQAPQLVQRTGQAGHALQRLVERGVSLQQLQAATQTPSFQYFHQGVWKTGWYDPASRIFVGLVNNVYTTVITSVTPQYIQNLRNAMPP